jgi:hypothetical protein
MKVLLNWFKGFINMVAATFVGGVFAVLVAFYIIYEAPVWLEKYCDNHDGGICQIQINDDDN